MRNIFFGLTLGVLFFSCSSESKIIEIEKVETEIRVETELMKCLNQAYSDQGLELKRTISDYQKKLVEENILRDSSSKSYSDLYEDIIDGKGLKYLNSGSLLEKFTRLSEPNQVVIRECQEFAVKNATSFDTNKIHMFENLVASVENSVDNNQTYSITEKSFPVLNQEDFELDYYKLRVLVMFDIMNTKIRESMSKYSSEEAVIEDYSATALNVSVNDDNKILIVNQEVDINKFKRKVWDYLTLNKSNSIIIISFSSKTTYKKYTSIYDAISITVKNLRDEYSIEKFGVEFVQLSKERKETVKEIYPQKVIEKRYSKNPTKVKY